MKALPAPVVRVLKMVPELDQGGESLKENEGWWPGVSEPRAVKRN